MTVLAGLLAGIVIGAVLGYLFAQGRFAGRAAAANERARAADERAALLERSITERSDATEKRITERFEVEQLVGPMKETLSRVEAQLRESDMQRAALAEQVALSARGTQQLREQTQALVSALRRPEARGRWGELQLRRVVELAGMTPHCDFDEQVVADGGSLRPDMVIRLTGGKNVVVDSKVSLAAYLEAVETVDDTVRAARLDAHARHVREHVDRLAAKSYWAALPQAPEFVILFIPGEAFLAPALERDPGLLEHALAKRVHIATPTTLVSMLRTAHYAWQQEALSQNARTVFELGRELYDRLSGLGRHVDRLGRALTNAVATYNQTVGSLESRVMVSARKLNDLGIVAGELTTPDPVNEPARTLSAPELVAAVLDSDGGTVGSDGAALEPAREERVGLTRSMP
jgi:DNA recombination protein RmuC